MKGIRQTPRRDIRHGIPILYCPPPDHVFTGMFSLIRAVHGKHFHGLGRGRWGHRAGRGSGFQFQDRSVRHFFTFMIWRILFLNADNKTIFTLSQLSFAASGMRVVPFSMKSILVSFPGRETAVGMWFFKAYVFGNPQSTAALPTAT